MSREITEQHRALVDRVKTVIYPWRRFTIAVDGVDHSGKSTTARFLSWQLGLPAVEADLFLADSDNGLPNYHFEMLRQVVAKRHDLNRPVIIEGVFIRETLERLGLASDFSIYVECEGHRGSETWQSAFSNYQAKFNPRDSANVVFTRSKNDG